MRYCVFFVAVVVLLGVCEGDKLACPALPPHTPTDIFDLRPNNIKVVMALGDSITAAFGVMGNAGKLNEFRGQSWSIGGDVGATTVPNFISTYVPNLVGASLGSHLIEYCGGPFCPDFQYHPNVDVFNAAQSGGMIMNLPTHELDFLLKQVATNPDVDIKNDWKLLTILIGANDICGACDGNHSYTGPEAFETYLTQTLERVRVTLPRTFVNLILGFNLSEVYNLGRKTLYCEAHQRVFTFECNCIFEKNATQTRLEVDIYTQLYNQKIFKIANYYKAQKFSDFAVVVQPFLYNTNATNFPESFLSTFDCFHPSLEAHQAFAIALWNSMLTPAANKKTQMLVNDVPICPTPNTLLYVN